ncbi:MAG: hypothetical protein PHV37_09400 [Candidatus Gastranaerophilales bacterium]|nr:hypothetical protein [Candidatus Gastranaerophilales bacterium]
MQNNSCLKISIAHLYPKLLNIYGDMGNIIAIKKRCQDRGIEVEVTDINPGDDIDISKFDLYFIGGGQDKQQIDVALELKKHEEKLKQAALEGKVFLGICGGYQLFGKYYQPHDGKKLEGISLLDAYTIAGDARFIGNVTAYTNFLEPISLVGFENHSGLTYLEDGTSPIAKVSVGNGNNGKDKGEGARKNNVFGTYLHGSLLPKNPHFADYLITLALETRYNDKIELTKLDDEFEHKAHFDLIGKSY